MTVVVASGGAHTISVPGPWLDFEFPSNNIQAMSKNPSARSAIARIGLRHLDGSICCFPGWEVGCVDFDDIPVVSFSKGLPGST